MKPNPSLLERLRRERGWTHGELYERCGVAPSMLSQYETGKRCPKIETAARLAEALGVKPSLLLADFARRSEQSAS